MNSVIQMRATFFRNVKDYKFSHKLTAEQKQEIEEALGVYTPNLVFVSADSFSNNKTYGDYSHRTLTIRINESYLNSNEYSTEESYHLYSTIRHEVRHAYQYTATYGLDIYGYSSRYNESKDLLRAWDSNIFNYISSAKGYAMYYSQPIEADARWFARQ